MVAPKADVFKIWENRGLKHILGLIFSAEICNLDSSKYSVLSNSYFDKDWSLIQRRIPNLVKRLRLSFFAEIINDIQLLTIFAKSSILDTWQGT